jgi:hypothetical protein
MRIIRMSSPVKALSADETSEAAYQRYLEAAAMTDIRSAIFGILTSKEKQMFPKPGRNMWHKTRPTSPETFVGIRGVMASNLKEIRIKPVLGNDATLSFVLEVILVFSLTGAVRRDMIVKTLSAAKPELTARIKAITGTTPHIKAFMEDDAPPSPGDTIP